MNSIGRKPLTSRTPLSSMSAKRRAALAEAGIINPFSTLAVRKPAAKPKRPTSTAPSHDIVEAVLERDGYGCVRCGDGIGDIRSLDWCVQHRVARGAGGTSLPERGLPGSLIILCGSALTGCHGAVERRRTDDEHAGYWIRRDCDGRPVDATTVPLRHALYGWVLLDNAGGWHSCAEPVERPAVAA